MVHRTAMADWRMLPTLRITERPDWLQAPDHAVSVSRESLWPPTLQHQDRHGYGRIEDRLSGLDIASFEIMTSLKSVASMKLHRDLGITQKSAWFLSQRLRYALSQDGNICELFSGPVEVDETYMGRKAGQHEQLETERTG